MLLIVKFRLYKPEIIKGNSHYPYTGLLLSYCLVMNPPEHIEMTIVQAALIAVTYFAVGCLFTQKSTALVG